MDQQFINAPASLAILVLTVVVSGLGLFVSPRIIERNLLRPYYLLREQRYDTLITKGFVHADLSHLFFNMLTFFFFAPHLERKIGTPKFIALYFVGLLAASLGTYVRRRRDPNYASLGASGAINTVMFAFIVYYPLVTINVFFAIPMPAFLYAVLFLAYSFWASKNARDNINHDAHFDGAIVGLLFVLVTEPDAWIRGLSRLFGG